MRTTANLIGGALLLALPTTGLAQGTDGAEDATYARVARDGVVLLNVPDDDGRVLIEAAAGDVVRIHGERAGWYKAELPDGFPAWIHGRYVEPTDETDVVRVTRNGVNVRPLPSAGVNNFPVGQLYAGDRVRVLDTPPELREEAADWVHIVSPPGFWAWIRSAEVSPVGPDEDGAEVWREARGLVARAREAGAGAGAEEAAPSPETESRARATKEALERAHTAFQRESARREAEGEEPDWALVRVAYEGVLELDPEPAVKRIVEGRLEQVAGLEEIAATRAELEAMRAAERERREEEAERIEEDIDREASRKDPFRRRFDERGLLERRTVGERTRYFLRWGGRDVCEVLCTSGRYDLDVFLGYDLGVRGEVLPLPGGAEEDAPPVLDLERIEVLARG